MQLFWIFTVSLFFWQLFVIKFNALDLAGDEAHYWEWSKRLDLAYFSKGPLIAYAIAFGTTLFGDTELGVRFAAPLSELIFSIVFFFHVRKNLGAELALLLLIAIRTTVIFLSMGFALTTDPLLLLFWTLALIEGEKAISRARPSRWALFGIWVGLAVLAKYTAVLLLLGAALYLILERDVRKDLLTPWPYLGAIYFLLIISPVVIWNLQHDWVNLDHNAGHLMGGATTIKSNYALELIGSQLGLFGPLLWPLLIYILLRGIKEWRSGDRVSGFYSTNGLLILCICLGVSLTRRVYANWPIPVAITAVLLLCRLLSDRTLLSDRVLTLIKVSIVFNLSLFVLIHLPLFGVTSGIPGRYLTTKKLVGWSKLSGEVKEIQATQAPNSFIAAESYETASELAFYLNRPGEILCGNFSPRRMNQYDIWGGWEKKKGQDALLVLKSEGLEVENLFKELIFLKEIPIVYSGDEIQRFKIYLGRELK